MKSQGKIRAQPMQIWIFVYNNYFILYYPETRKPYHLPPRNDTLHQKGPRT
jgi:hypothetical protein